MITNGVYIHSEDIKNEHTWNALIKAATDQGLDCRWSWADWCAVQEEGKVSRLVARIEFAHQYIDVESSPFGNRVRVTVDQWINNDLPPAQPEIFRIPMLSRERVDVLVDINNFMYANGHELAGVSKDTHHLDGWEIQSNDDGDGEFFLLHFYDGGCFTHPHKVSRTKVEELMADKVRTL